MEKKFAQTYTKHGEHRVMSRARAFLLLLPLCLVSLLFSAAATDTSDVRKFTIIQFNDVYEIFPLRTLEERSTALRGGLAYAATLINQARKREPVLVLHAGDFLSPSLLSIRFGYKGKQMIDGMNALGVDYVTLGNHEFDFGCEVLAQRIRESNFSWLVANVQLPKDIDIPEGKVDPFRIITIAGLRVGIFGLTVPMREMEECRLSGIRFDDPFSSAATAIRELSRQRVDMIVALTHLRIEQDRRLAEIFPNIDLIVGGHDHEPMVEAIGQTLITKAGANALHLGIIEIKARKTAKGWSITKAWKPKPVDPDLLPADPAVAAALAPYDQDVKALQQVIGRTEVALDVREETVRERESNFGNYVTDLMRSEMKADIALINGGALRGDRIIPPGPLTLHDLYSVLLFDNRLQTVRVTGQQLLEALENGVSLTGETSGRFPQISGMRFSFDPTKPLGRRIVTATVGDAPVDPKRTYILATTDFLVEHGTIDGYTLPRTVLNSGAEIKQVVVKNLEKTAIRCSTEGRIVDARLTGQVH